MKLEFLRTDPFRRGMAEIAKEVAHTGQTVPIGTTVGRPRYLLRPATRPESNEICVRVGLDEMRRNFTEIRALIRLEGVPFGILVEGQLLAVLTRHPDYRPAAAEHYREMIRQQGGGGAATFATLESRIAVLEIALTAIAGRLAKFEGRMPDPDARTKIR
jgi:hypothetical protein